MADRSKIAFGSEAQVEAALESGKINAFDILCLDEKKIGWIDENGNPVIIEGKQNVVRVDELPTEAGQEDVIYLYQGQGYVWNAEAGECVPMCKPQDLSELEAELAGKADADEVNEKFESLEKNIERVYEEIKYEVTNKPDGTLVDYRDKEIRVMCPADTEWVLQQSGAGADPNSYYIGMKAYAPNNTIVGFKEDLKETIEDTTMYDFNGEFAGVDVDGRKYSIVWLPVAKYDNATSTWTYYGANSNNGKYIGWFYSVEWYNENGDVVSSDRIRVNLANENSYSSIEPYYMNDVMTKVEEKLNSVSQGIEIVRF